MFLPETDKVVETSNVQKWVKDGFDRTLIEVRGLGSERSNRRSLRGVQGSTHQRNDVLHEDPQKPTTYSCGE